MSKYSHAVRAFIGAALLLSPAACAEQPLPEAVPQIPAPAPVAAQDSARADTAIVVRADTVVAVRADTVRVDTALHDTLAAKPAPRRRASATDSVPWPDLSGFHPDALLPSHRIIAFYGNPLSKRMGILGEIPPEQMLAKLEQTAAEWSEADSTTTVLPALHMIVTVAQAQPGRDGKYRLRMTDSVIDRVAQWAEERGWLFFVDIQTGHSTIEAELPHLIPFLRRPYVHLALDPEFSMKDGSRPGRRIGTMDASDINHAIGFLSDLVEAEGLPPKILVVHRFTNNMLTNASKIRRDPNVQVVIDMDGFGAPSLKRSTWRIVVQRDPVQYTGFKLFYKNDKPMLTPEQVIDLFPSPVYIQYQ